MSEDRELTKDQILASRDSAIEQIKFAREYLLGLLGNVPASEWFTIPDGCVSNIAWQVGHLTVAQYGLLLFRQRGRAENDTLLMPSPFRKKFAKGTDPASIVSTTISQAELLAAAKAIYDESLAVVGQLDAATLWEPIDMPYAGYARKLGAILFCPLHEMLHAGQIGTLRRALGLTPVR